MWKVGKSSKERQEEKKDDEKWNKERLMTEIMKQEKE